MYSNKLIKCWLDYLWIKGKREFINWTGDWAITLLWHQSTPVSLMTNTHVVILVTFSLQELPNFLPESASHTYSLSLSTVLCAHTLQFSSSKPQGQRLFYIPSVISFLDRLKHKHYKGLQLRDLLGPGKESSLLSNFTTNLSPPSSSSLLFDFFHSVLLSLPTWIIIIINKNCQGCEYAEITIVFV